MYIDTLTKFGSIVNSPCLITILIITQDLMILKLTFRTLRERERERKKIVSNSNERLH